MFIEGGEYVDRQAYIKTRDENTKLTERVEELKSAHNAALELYCNAKEGIGDFELRIAELEKAEERAMRELMDASQLANKQAKEIQRLRGLLVRNNICPKCGDDIVVDYRAGKAVNHRCKGCGWAALEGEDK